MSSNAQSSLTNLGTTSTLFIGSSFTLHCDANVNNEAGATLQFDGSSSSLLQLKGHFTNSTSGVLTSGVGTISFVGSSAQNADFGGDNLYNLKISNTSGDVTLTSAATVTNNLNFTSGDLVTTDANIISLSAAATSTGAADGNHVNGPINKTTASTSQFTFPVGNGSKYRPNYITPSTNSSTTWKSKYYFANPFSHVIDNTFNHMTYVEYWKCARTSGTANGVVTLSWDAVSGVQETSSMTTLFWTGATWTNGGGNNITGTTSAGTVDSDSWTTWNGNASDFWTLGAKGLLNTLPVELIDFTATKNNSAVLLKWQTASEINSNYFDLQHSTDGINFNTINTTKAAGTSTALHNYYHVHENPAQGTNYYQLIEYDFDGKSQKSNIIPINFSNEINQIIQLYPNPSNDITTLYFNSEEGGIYYLNIIDAGGKNIFSAMIPALLGENKFSLSMEKYAGGNYYINLIDPQQKSSSTLFAKQD